MIEAEALFQLLDLCGERRWIISIAVEHLDGLWISEPLAGAASAFVFKALKPNWAPISYIGVQT